MNVTVNNLKPTERFTKVVQDRISEWANLRTDHLVDGEVAFFDEESLGEEVSCLIVLTIDGEQYRAWETSNSLRSALERSISCLTKEETEP